ncbi:MAG TPA: MEDS domain-containing protein [Thermoanaerobaculia bacterium]|nr:MEDS domain-containing protein [Thermoanaerobaculia bacterium]
MAKHRSRVVSVVDDDASLRRSLTRLLESAGWEVETFASAEAFLAASPQARVGCVLLDLHMPGMGGLDLLRRLTATGWGRRVIVVTAHGGDGTRRRCLQAGAAAFLEKPVSSAALLEAVGSAMSHASGERTDPTVDPGDRSIELAGGAVGIHRHVCAFFNSAEEEHRVLRSFIKDGIDAGEKAFHVVDPGRRDDHLTRLRQAGIDVERTLAAGQLEVRPWHEAHLRGDRFEMDGMLELVEEVLQESAAAGYPRTRVVGHMEWALLDNPGVDDLLEYEARANYVLPKYDDVVICTYDLSRFDARVAMDVMRTHPAVIIGGVLQENPFFVPPDQFLLEIRERRSARKGPHA